MEAQIVPTLADHIAANIHANAIPYVDDIPVFKDNEQDHVCPELSNHFLITDDLIDSGATQPELSLTRSDNTTAKMAYCGYAGFHIVDPGQLKPENLEQEQTCCVRTGQIIVLRTIKKVWTTFKFKIVSMLPL